MRVLFADKLPDSARVKLQESGCEVIVDAALKDDSLITALAEHDPDVLVVRSTLVRADHFAAARSLQLVVRAGAGVNTIDLETASTRGVYVSNCPGMNAVAVAELTFAHILNADRRIADNAADLRAGHWRKKVYSKDARGLKSRTLGVLGCGAIGVEVIRRARAFDMDVVAWSRSLTDAQAAAMGARRVDSAVELARASDVLSIHLALTPATRGFVGSAILDALRPGAILVNTSRGGVIDEAELIKAIRGKGLRVGLDVFHDEPSSDGDWTTEIAQLDGVWGTHHIGASTDQAQESVADEAIRVILSWRETGAAPNCVNLAERTPATHLLVVRHEDRVGVLAIILDLLREREINVQQMENVVFSGARAACARLELDSPPDARLLEILGDQAPIFDVKLVQLDP